MGIRSFFSRRKKPNSSTDSSSGNPIESGSGSGSVSFSAQTRTLNKELESVFKKFDVNGDGKISWSELGAIMGSLGHSATEEELQRMVKEVDSDGDGFIDLNEFIELNTKEVDTKTVMDDLKSAFSIYDADGNGLISPQELQTVLRSLGDERSIGECKKMINGVDCDGDGLINFEEFKRMMLGSGSDSSQSTTTKLHGEIAISEN